MTDSPQISHAEWSLIQAGLLRAQAVCNVLYACGALRHHPGSLAQAVQADMVQRPQAYDQRDWVRILWALSTLMEPPRQLLHTLSTQVGSLLFQGIRCSTRHTARASRPVAGTVTATVCGHNSAVPEICRVHRTTEAWATPSLLHTASAHS